MFPSYQTSPGRPTPPWIPLEVSEKNATCFSSLIFCSEIDDWASCPFRGITEDMYFPLVLEIWKLSLLFLPSEHQASGSWGSYQSISLSHKCFIIKLSCLGNKVPQKVLLTCHYMARATHTTYMGQKQTCTQPQSLITKKGPKSNKRTPNGLQLQSCSAHIIITADDQTYSYWVPTVTVTCDMWQHLKQTLEHRLSHLWSPNYTLLNSASARRRLITEGTLLAHCQLKATLSQWGWLPLLNSDFANNCHFSSTSSPKGKLGKSNL